MITLNYTLSRKLQLAVGFAFPPRLFALALVSVILSAFIPMAHATPGDLDPLNPTLVGNYVLATAVQPDGRVIVGGSFTSMGGVTHNYLARVAADGTVDGCKRQIRK